MHTHYKWNSQTWLVFVLVPWSSHCWGHHWQIHPNLLVPFFKIVRTARYETANPGTIKTGGRLFISYNACTICTQRVKKRIDKLIKFCPVQNGCHCWLHCANIQHIPTRKKKRTKDRSNSSKSPLWSEFVEIWTPKQDAHTKLCSHRLDN